METATVDLLLSTRRLRADLPMRGFTRLSDMLNNTPGEFLAGTLRDHCAARDGAPSGTDTLQRDLVVRLSDVLLIHPLDSATPPAAPSNERRDRISQRMVLELGDWRLEGSLHLVDSVRWVDFASSMNARFLAVTGARVSVSGAQASFEAPFLLVNGSRVSALYEC